MDTTTGVPFDITHAIQLAVAPVFLLTGIAGLLNVMAGRLGRIIDRDRCLTESPSRTNLSPDKIAAELRSLERRRHFASVAITACTLSALLVCLVIAILFVEVMTGLPLKWLVGVLFTFSTVAVVVGLTFFLCEVRLATQSMRIDSKRASPKKPDA